MLKVNFLKELLKKELEEVETLITSSSDNRESLIKLVVDHISSSKGKQLRPILTLLSAKIFNYSGDNHIKLAASLESIHLATLLHDDVIDESTSRRSLETANIIWGNKPSILVGDYLFTHSFNLMTQTNSFAALTEIAKASSIIVEGEIKQLSCSNNLSIDIDTYLDIIQSKTAELFGTCAKVGAMIATNDEKYIEQLYIFGQNLGLIFQMGDDILDYLAEDNILGKNLGEDFKEGKVTLPVILAYKQGDHEEKKFWQRCMEAQNQTRTDFFQAQTYLKTHEIITKIKDISEAFQIKAEDALNTLPDNKYREGLSYLLDIALNRF